MFGAGGWLGAFLCFGSYLDSFHPETALSPNFGVNPFACVCGINNYASVQALDFLDFCKKPGHKKPGQIYLTLISEK